LFEYRFFSYVATAPSSLNDHHTIATYISSKDIAEIFEVEMMCLYIKIPEKPGQMLKYTRRHSKPEIIDITSKACLVNEVIRIGIPVRINNLDNFVFDPIIDGMYICIFIHSTFVLTRFYVYICMYT
jgi:hypothetical protein